MSVEFVGWTTDIMKMLEHRKARGSRFAVSAHIRTGEYTFAYATSAEDAAWWEHRFRKRKCHQIRVTPPEIEEGTQDGKE